MEDNIFFYYQLTFIYCDTSYVFNQIYNKFTSINYILGDIKKNVSYVKVDKFDTSSSMPRIISKKSSCLTSILYQF